MLPQQGIFAPRHGAVDVQKKLLPLYFVGKIDRNDVGILAICQTQAQDRAGIYDLPDPLPVGYLPVAPPAWAAWIVQPYYLLTFSAYTAPFSTGVLSTPAMAYSPLI